jgi:hypothetical protein
MTTVRIADDLYMTLDEDGRHSFFAPGDYIGGKLSCPAISAKDTARDDVERVLMCEPVAPLDAIAYALPTATVAISSPVPRSYDVPSVAYAAPIGGLWVQEVVTCTFDCEPAPPPPPEPPLAVPLPGGVGLLVASVVALVVLRRLRFQHRRRLRNYLPPF